MSRLFFYFYNINFDIDLDIITIIFIIFKILFKEILNITNIHPEYIFYHFFN